MLASDKGHIPQARAASRVLLDWHLVLELAEHLFALRIVRQVGREIFQGRKLNWGAYQQYGFALLAGHDDLMRGAYAVNIGGAISDNEVTGIDHAQINMHGRPEGLRKRRTGLGALR